MLNDKRIRVITGHYGSGKTEFAVNYAIKLAKDNNKVAIADLDVVNPYFRSREKEEVLTNLGIRVIGSSIKGSGSDLPAISGEVLTPLQDESFEAVLDVGGDPVGARALGRYHSYFKEDKYDMFFVINANRPETQTKQKTIDYLRSIEFQSRAKITGLINNTHLLKSTTVEDVLRGQELCKEVSEELNIPIKYISCIESVAKELPEDLDGEIFPIKMYMREDWMS
ncbi:ATP-binding protein [Clostridium sp. D2Q-11]|uniref:ATP-binding protein n=1 Tax=Anaeromonas frigoriresistens TaxID=2683708 RepID=A0A942USD0_9FIRM|nr:ATP-binding protein [Anaeromonas frigoriresistens]MBS4538278.1 ATP-binding protein [Anaeromonas frigoriresistens]